MIYYPTVIARYSLFVLKVPLNSKQTNKHSVILPISLQTWLLCCDVTLLVRWHEVVMLRP